MNLQDYEWSHNPRGLQNKGPFQSVDPRRYTRPQAGWAALVVGGDEYVDEAAELVESGVTPIVRIHRSSPGAMPVPVSATVNMAWGPTASSGIVRDCVSSTKAFSAVIVSRPPSGMASRALMHRFSTSWQSSVLSPITGHRSLAERTCTSIDLGSVCSRMFSTSPITFASCTAS